MSSAASGRTKLRLQGQHLDFHPPSGTIPTMPKFQIPPYSSLDKSFRIEGPIPLIVDNDDVPTDQVAILARHLVDCLNAYWQDPMAWFCENEDCEQYWQARERGWINKMVGWCPDCGHRMDLKEISL